MPESTSDSASPRAASPNWLGGATIIALILLWALRDIAVLVGLSLLLAYALDPFVVAFERIKIRGRSMTRTGASAVVMLLMVVPAGFAVSWAMPQVVAELLRFIERAPGIVADILLQLRDWANTHGFAQYVDPVTEVIKSNAASAAQNATGLVTSGLGRLFGGLGVLLGLAVLPLLAFYLLAEREDVKTSAFGFIPPTHHDQLLAMGTAVDLALRSYVRGQAIVCLVMGVAVGVVLALLQFPLALFLGVVVGFAEVVPYLGFLAAALAIVLVGFTIGPFQALIGLAAYTLVNNLVGVFVTPRVMGRYLKMHPYVVTISVLAGAKLLGAAGVLLALPLAAVVQALASELGPKRKRRS